MGRVQGAVPFYVNAHKVRIQRSKDHSVYIGGTPQNSGNGCVFTGRTIAHYSMAQEAVALAHRKVADQEYAKVYAGITKLVEHCPQKVKAAGCVQLNRMAHAFINKTNPFTCDASCVTCLQPTRTAQEE